MSISQIGLTTSDLYYICQMVDRVSSDSSGWMRSIEDFAGDMSCERLLGNFPKWTPLHDFIEFVIVNVSYEDASSDDGDFLVSEDDPIDIARRGKNPWIDMLLASNGFESSFRKYVANGGEASLYEYLQDLNLGGPMHGLLFSVTRQVFHVLFPNRKVLHNFGEMMTYYVKEVGASIYPNRFTKSGALIRCHVPSWAKSAVFHRDKGCCVFCGCDLTKLVNQRGKLHFDHVIPLIQGGMNDVTNLQLLCSDCNLTKGGSNKNTSYRVDEWYPMI